MNNVKNQMAMCEMLADDLGQKVRMRLRIMACDPYHSKQISNYIHGNDPGSPYSVVDLRNKGLNARGCHIEEITAEIRMLRRELMSLQEMIQGGAYD